MASAAVCLAAAARPRRPLLNRAPSPSTPYLHLRALPCRRRIPLPAAVRAGFRIPSGLGRAGGVESDRLQPEVRKRAMDAVDSFGGRVTIGDVAGRAGLKVNESERALQALAADAGGFLEIIGTFRIRFRRLT